MHQSVVWSRCSANQEIRKSYQKASLELLFLQIWKSRKLEKPYHKATLRLQFLCFQEFNKTQTVRLQCLGISSTLLQKSRMATFIHSLSCMKKNPGKLEIQQNGKFRIFSKTGKLEFPQKWKSIKLRCFCKIYKPTIRHLGVAGSANLQIWKSRILDKPYQKASLGLQFQILGIQQNTNGLVTVSCCSFAEKQNGHFCTISWVTVT